MAEPAIMETLRAYSPPHSEEAERAVLSALMLDNGLLPAGRTEQYAQIIKERAQKRQLIEAAGAGG